MSNSRLILLVIPLVVLAGCVVGPDYQKPTTSMPSTWQTKTDHGKPNLDDWWKVLNDPVLDQLIATSVRENLDLSAAKARVRQARASLASVGGTVVPQIDYGATFVRSGSEGSVPQTQTNGGFATQWEIDLFGGNRRSIEAAYRELEGTNEELRAALVTLVSDVASNYVELRGVQASIGIAQENARLQRQTVELTRTRLEAGYISRVDLLSAETQAASTESQIPSLRISYSNTISALSVLSGQNPFALNQLFEKRRAIPRSPAIAPNGVPADLLLNRPDIRAAERAYAASTAGIGRAQAMLYPGISLTGSINTSGTRLGDLARLSSVGWNLGPTVSVPIFDGGRLKADVEFAKASRDVSFFTYHKAVISALAEVEAASVALNQNRARVGQQQRIVENSREINRLTLDQFQSGRRSFIDVLNSQRNLLNAETSLSQSRVDAVASYINLQRALGGIWSDAIDVDSPAVQDGQTGPHPISHTQFANGGTR